MKQTNVIYFGQMDENCIKLAAQRSHEKASSSSSPKDTEKKKIRTSCFGKSGFKSIAALNSKMYDLNTETGKAIDKAFCVGCIKSFKN